MLKSQGKQVNKQKKQQQQQNWLNNKKVVSSNVDVMHEQWTQAFPNSFSESPNFRSSLQLNII